MTESTDHVLAAIDNAINDGLSPDAMRWTPEPPDEPQIRIRLDTTAFHEAFRNAGAAVQAAAYSMGHALREMGVSVNDSYARYDDSELPEWERELIDREYLEQQVGLHGNAYIEVERDD